jgi:hypothetical protein
VAEGELEYRLDVEPFRTFHNLRNFGHADELYNCGNLFGAFGSHELDAAVGYCS